MAYDVWARFDDPESYGEGYVDDIETALRANGRERITLEDVQRRFKDYKNSGCIQHCYDDPLIGDSRVENAITVMNKYNLNSSSSHCDGSGYFIPEETARMYDLLWDSFIEFSEKPRRFPNNIDCMKYIFKFKQDSQLHEYTASGDTMNSFDQVFKKAMGCEDVEQAFSKYRAEGAPPDIEEQLAIFAYLTHTAGNFIPMPGNQPSPNQAHENYPGTDRVRDRWDLFIDDIRKWYIFNGRDEWLPTDKHAYSGCIGSYAADSEDSCFYKWLKSFGDSFELFITKNYLHDYYNFDSHEIRFYDEQLLSYDNKPGRLIQMNARIISRNIRMRWEAAKRIAEGDGEYDIGFIFDSMTQQDA